MSRCSRRCWAVRTLQQGLGRTPDCALAMSQSSGHLDLECSLQSLHSGYSESQSRSWSRDLLPSDGSSRPPGPGESSLHGPLRRDPCWCHWKPAVTNPAILPASATQRLGCPLIVMARNSSGFVPTKTSSWEKASSFLPVNESVSLQTIRHQNSEVELYLPSFLPKWPLLQHPFSPGVFRPCWTSFHRGLPQRDPQAVR